MDTLQFHEIQDVPWVTKTLEHLLIAFGALFGKIDVSIAKSAIDEWHFPLSSFPFSFFLIPHPLSLIRHPLKAMFKLLVQTQWYDLYPRALLKLELFRKNRRRSLRVDLRSRDGRSIN